MGPGAVPHICTNCHSGQYDPGTHLVHDAHFLPINPFFVKFPDVPPAPSPALTGLTPGQTRFGQQERIRQINALALTSNLNAEQINYFTALYSGRPTTPLQQPVFAVPGDSNLSGTGRSW